MNERDYDRKIICSGCGKAMNVFEAKTHQCPNYLERNQPKWSFCERHNFQYAITESCIYCDLERADRVKKLVESGLFTKECPNCKKKSMYLDKLAGQYKCINPNCYAYQDV